MRGSYLFVTASAVVQESVLPPAQICSRGRQRSTGGREEAESEKEGKGLPPPQIVDPLGVFFC